MRIIYADCYGFCKGVRAAVDTAESALCRAASLSVPCYALGDIVHNDMVMGKLKEHGLAVVPADEIEAPGIVVIRAHGVPDSLRADLGKSGLEIADATCPVVLRSQRLLRESRHRTIVIGVSGHSEVTALMGSGRDSVLVESEEDLQKLDNSAVYDAVVQTTFSLPLLERIRAKADELGISISYLNTICHASVERREALKTLLPRVEALVVCGDANSRNTGELVEEGRRAGKPSFLVSSPHLVPAEVFSFGATGLTTGASCPDTLIRSIERRLLDG